MIGEPGALATPFARQREKRVFSMFFSQDKTVNHSKPQVKPWNFQLHSSVPLISSFHVCFPKFIARFCQGSQLRNRTVKREAAFGGVACGEMCLGGLRFNTQNLSQNNGANQRKPTKEASKDHVIVSHCRCSPFGNI